MQSSCIHYSLLFIFGFQFCFTGWFLEMFGNLHRTLAGGKASEWIHSRHNTQSPCCETLIAGGYWGSWSFLLVIQTWNLYKRLGSGWFVLPFLDGGKMLSCKTNIISDTWVRCYHRLRWKCEIRKVSEFSMNSVCHQKMPLNPLISFRHWPDAEGWRVEQTLQGYAAPLGKPYLANGQSDAWNEGDQQKERFSIKERGSFFLSQKKDLVERHQTLQMWSENCWTDV